ncbi:AAA family ATPase [Microlunatus sp. Gsoil 973]|nr:AAA family ATPase [Microlunatus sp. Gsoil 973]
MGVSGAGKTTVAEILARRLGWLEAEADDFHPPANVAKMHSGIPLTDEDREPWLAALRDWITKAPGSVILTCSALRRSYRDVLRSANARVEFLHLDGDHDLIRQRITSRSGHFMPASLLDSQFATLEPLQPDEPGLVADVADEPEAIADQAVRALRLGN